MSTSQLSISVAIILVLALAPPISARMQTRLPKSMNFSVAIRLQQFRPLASFWRMENRQRSTGPD